MTYDMYRCVLYVCALTSILTLLVTMFILLVCIILSRRSFNGYIVALGGLHSLWGDRGRRSVYEFDPVERVDHRR